MSRFNHKGHKVFQKENKDLCVQVFFNHKGHKVFTKDTRKCYELKLETRNPGTYLSCMANTFFMSIDVRALMLLRMFFSSTAIILYTPSSASLVT